MEEKINPHHCHSCGYGLTEAEAKRHSQLVQADMKEQAEQIEKASLALHARLEREALAVAKIMKENG